MSVRRATLRSSLRTSLVLLVPLATAPALAQTFRDQATGLAITPPAGYTAQPGPDSARYGVTVNVKRAEDNDTGCRVGFQPAPQNATLTQAEINKMAVTPEREDVIRRTLSALYEVKTLRSFAHDGVTGVTALAEIKMIPNIPARAADLQNVFYMFETPKGRTNIICVVEKTAYEQRRGEFEALARGTKVPR
jgi:hypothetical protein